MRVVRTHDVGVALRGRSVSEAQRVLGHAFREALDKLDHALEARDAELARTLALAVNRVGVELRAAYLKPTAAGDPL